MSILLESQIKSLRTEGLLHLVEDVEKRIGSHVAGGDPVDEYVQQQRYILDLVQEELKRRNTCHV
ncbi:DUF6877 family protein [Pseudobacillus wudalianchiensis]|uniref:Uncharacterized protein n=1 Tax=Pseudobacillus wudalianchiensis TaxID=1743143 RepID=A0A1B9AU63_9BACI|nr:DUF6877 family protein [Bacillus wudalianchiensis]OCA87311.1 hypothetical protein A8F95_08675 [Bacillus wudalianchiensis]